MQRIVRTIPFCNTQAGILLKPGRPITGEPVAYRPNTRDIRPARLLSLIPPFVCDTRDSKDESSFHLAGEVG